MDVTPELLMCSIIHVDSRAGRDACSCSVRWPAVDTKDFIDSGHIVRYNLHCYNDNGSNFCYTANDIVEPPMCRNHSSVCMDDLATKHRV